MTYDTNSTHEADESLRVVVTDIRQPQAPEPDPLADPELHPYINRILHMDPVTDVRGAVEGRGGDMPNITADALPPDLRSEVLRQLHALPPEQRKAAEADLVHAAVRSRVLQTRVMTGVHATSLPYHKEQLEIAAQVRQLDEQKAFYQEQLDRVEYETRFDPETGKRVPVAVPVLSEARRKAYAQNIRDIEGQRNQLVRPDGTNGVEAQRRINAAVGESARILQHLDRQREERAEVKRRAEAINRERRINAQAEALASMTRNEVR